MPSLWNRAIEDIGFLAEDQVVKLYYSGPSIWAALLDRRNAYLYLNLRAYEGYGCRWFTNGAPAQLEVPYTANWYLGFMATDQAVGPARTFAWSIRVGDSFD